MDMRAAKRLACKEGSLIIRNAIEAGWEFEVGLSEEDAERYRAALYDLTDQLASRGEGAPVIPARELFQDPIPDDEIGLASTRPPI